MSAYSQFQQDPGARHDESGELFESFAAPRTVPAGWDLSELVASGNGRPSRTEGAAAASIDSPAPGGGEHNPAAERDRFPKPNTYPSQWDLSA
jgi:hypothetical protein